MVSLLSAAMLHCSCIWGSRNMRSLLAGVSLLFLSAISAHAQVTVKDCIPITNTAAVGGAQSCQDVTNTALPQANNGPAVAVTGTSGNVAAAVATATLPVVLNRTNWISGFEFTSAGATGASVVTCTLTGTISGTMSYTIAVTAGATLGNTPLVVEFTNPVPASGVGVALTASCPSLGAGNTNATMNIHGFIL